MAGILLSTPAAALAQVTVNPAALRQLAGISAPPPPSAPPVVHHHARVHHAVAARFKPRAPIHHQVNRAPVHRAPETTAPVQQAAARVAAPPAPKPAAAKPPAPMPPKSLPPKSLPPKPLPPKPLPPVSVVFAPGSATLPANAAAALQPYCAARRHVAVDARAPADASDPSAAMRLSLARAMAVQQVLTACGVPPQDILPRADGDVPGQNENAAVIGGGAKR